MKTNTIFRKFDNGDIIAIFPDEIADMNGNPLSYMHIGQHGATSLEPDNTVLATPVEYAALKLELERIGYILNIL